jgi:adenylate cyclase
MAMDQEAVNELMWRRLLSGELANLRRFRSLFSLVPAALRCQICRLPYSGVGGFILRKVFHKYPSGLNPHFCNNCENFAAAYPGGAVVRITMLFTDIRGSTGMAENLSPREFTRILNRFYAAATSVVFPTQAWIDKLVGDEVIALFIPGFVGEDHARLAVETAQKLLGELGYGTPEGAWLPAGVGIHTDDVYVGAVGAKGITDITALGDGMNTTARLVSNAAAGEILISQSTYEAAGLGAAGLEERQLQVKGRMEPVTVRVMTVDRRIST